MIVSTVVILGVYLVFILAIGVYSGRGAGKDTESFFVANRSLNWLQESMAVFTTTIPAAALVGTIGLFYAGGANMLGYLISYSFLMPLTYWYVGSRLRRLGRAKGYQTQAVFIGDFYQSRYLRWAVTIAGIAFSIPILMTGPVAMGYLLDHYTGIPYAAGVLLFLAVSAAYTLKGGLRAVANTDIFHGVLLLLFLIAAIAAVVTHAGGIMRVLDTPKATVASTGPGLELFFAWIFYVGLGTCVQPDRAFRMFAVKNEANLRNGVILSGVMVALSALTFLTIGLAVHSFAPDIKQTDTTLATGLELAAPWLIPWFVMNAWGGGMSAFTAGLLSVANIFIKDAFEPWYVSRHAAGDSPDKNRQIVLASRGFIVCMILITAGVSFYPPPFIWSLINITVGSLLQFFPMFVLGFSWRRVTWLGAASGWTAGVICMALWSFVYKPPFGPLAGVDALAVNVAVLIVVSLLVPETKERRATREALRTLAMTDVDATPRRAEEAATLMQPQLGT
jgi:solute:Na+ symporter, SSS family